MSAPIQPALGRMSTAMITPMTAGYEIDFAGAEVLANHLVAQGNDALIINGTTGESPTTSDAEKAELVRVVRAAVPASVRIIAGAGSNDTRHSIVLAQQAEAAGADGLLVVTPYYSKPSQAGVVAHFHAVADASGLPIMLYDIPGRAGVALNPETIVAAAQHPRIVAVKDAKSNLASAIEVLRQSDLLWYCGDDDLNLPYLSIGATGFVSVAGHLVSRQLADMISAMDAGNVAEARNLAFQVAPIAVGLFRSPAVTLAKAALELQGLPAGPPRMPLLPATASEIAQLKLDMAAAGVAWQE